MSSGLVHASVLIDGTGAEPVADGVVLFADGRITFAGPARDAPSTAGASNVYESSGAIVPGIIDCHVHLTFSGDADPVTMLSSHGRSIPSDATCARKSAAVFSVGMRTNRAVSGMRWV